MSIPVAISKGRKGYLVVLSSLFLVLMMFASLSMDIINILIGKIFENFHFIETTNETYLAVILNVRPLGILTCSAAGAAFVSVSAFCFYRCLCRPACYHISILFIKKFNIGNFFSQNGAAAVIIGSGIRSIEYPINGNPLLYGGII
ncbi:MAG: hypothetical protein HGJ91_01330 [Desulfobacula sp.]|nr:hypothetical protein [Desulfobacula sp.]